MGKSTILLFVLSLFTACSGTKDVKEDAGTIILEAGFEGGGKNTPFILSEVFDSVDRKSVV